MFTTKLKQYIVPTFTKRAAARKPSFFDLAKKNIVKGKKRGQNDLSKRVDEIVYGI